MAVYESFVKIVDAPGSLPANSFFGQLAFSQSNKKWYVFDGANWVIFANGLAIDGDKGDITISVNGTTYTIDNDVVTYAKMQDISATQRVLGRNSAGAGDTEEVTASQVLDWRTTTRGAMLYRGAVTWDGINPSATSGQVITSNGAGADPTYQNPGGYVLPVQCAAVPTFTDAQTIYFGGTAGSAPVTGTSAQRMYVPKAGTVVAAYVYVNCGTAGSNENWTLDVAVNFATFTAIATVASAANLRVWSNTGLSIAVGLGDQVAIRSVNPTWATNPATGAFGGHLYIR